MGLKAELVGGAMIVGGVFGWFHNSNAMLHEADHNYNHPCLEVVGKQQFDCSTFDGQMASLNAEGNKNLHSIHHHAHVMEGAAGVMAVGFLVELVSLGGRLINLDRDETRHSPTSNSY